MQQATIIENAKTEKDKILNLLNNTLTDDDQHEILYKILSMVDIFLSGCGKKLYDIKDDVKQQVETNKDKYSTIIQELQDADRGLCFWVSAQIEDYADRVRNKFDDCNRISLKKTKNALYRLEKKKNIVKPTIARGLKQWKEALALLVKNLFLACTIDYKLCKKYSEIAEEDALVCMERRLGEEEIKVFQLINRLCFRKL